jgi:hypothetical protein
MRRVRWIRFAAASWWAETSIDLHIGYVTRSDIGACGQLDGYDFARLRDRVAYRDVGVPLQATRYELPDLDLP